MSVEQFGPYRLEALIVEHATGCLYRAHDTLRERTVAINQFTEAHSADLAFQERFSRDCQLVAGLTEPHIVPIHDYGEIDGRLFVDMRFVEGTNLAAVLEENGPLDPARTVNMISQVAGALDAAHAVGLVHGDVRPRNLLLGDTDQGFVHIINFSLVDLNVGPVPEMSDGEAVPTTGVVGYTAPERFTTDECDHAVDVYALTCVLFEMLTGKPPFQGDDRAVMFRHTAEEAPRPSTALAELPSGFDAVVARGMAKVPAERFPSAGALADAALAVLDAGKPVSVATTGVEGPVGERTAKRLAPPTTFREAPSTVGDSGAPDAGPPTALNIALRSETVVPSAPVETAATLWGRLGDRRMLVAGLVVVLALGTIAGLLLNGDPPPPEEKAKTVDTVVSQIAVGSRPEGVAVSRDGSHVYVANAASDTVSVIDSRGQKVIATIPVGHDPRDVAITPDGNRVYVANFGSSSVSVIASQQNRVISTVPTGKGAKSVAITPDGQRAFVTNLYSDSVSVINTANDTVMTTVPAGDGPSEVVLSADGLRAFVTDIATGTVATINTQTNIMVSNAAAGAEPERIAVTPDGQRSYVTMYLQNAVRVIDNVTNAAIATVSVGRAPLGLSVTPDGRRVYIANVGSGSLSIVDTGTNTLVSSLSMPGVKGAADVAIAADGRRAYATSRDANMVTVIELGD